MTTTTPPSKTTTASTAWCQECGTQFEKPQSNAIYCASCTPAVRQKSRREAAEAIREAERLENVQRAELDRLEYEATVAYWATRPRVDASLRLPVPTCAGCGRRLYTGAECRCK